jgi:DNA repair photolyase
MGLNESKGNMYDFINFTWNTIKGKCYHDCAYCFMKRWGELKPIRFDEKELKTDLGEGNFIFVGSSCDMFNSHIPKEWIHLTLEKCAQHNNRYFFQSKDINTMAYWECTLVDLVASVCTTIETNRFYGDIMGKAPVPKERAMWLSGLDMGLDRYVTIEPIIDFDLEPMVDLIKSCNPLQVNLGANTSSKIRLPEPSKNKILDLIGELEKFTKIHSKKNLGRLLI